MWWAISAESLFSLGRWDEADAVLARQTSASAGLFDAALYEVRGRLHALRGRYDDAAADLAAMRRLVGDRPVSVQYAQPLAFIQAEIDRAAGELPAARESVAAALPVDPAGHNVRYGWPLVWAGMRVEAELLQLARDRRADAPADHDERLAALDALVASLPAASGEADAYRALTAAERTRLTATPAAAPWPAAADAARAARSTYLLAYASLRLAEAHAALGDRDAAGAAVAEAIALADALGAAPLADEARALAQPRPPGGRRAGSRARPRTRSG